MKYSFNELSMLACMLKKDFSKNMFLNLTYFLEYLLPRRTPKGYFWNNFFSHSQLSYAMQFVPVEIHLFKWSLKQARTSSSWNYETKFEQWL